MHIPKIEFKTLFKAFVLFAIFYNGYRYFFPWDRGGQAPSMPLYFSIFKDIPWAIVVFLGLYVLYRNRKLHIESTYRGWDNFNTMTTFFVITHLVLFVVALMHLFHKNPIDVLQRDIKNVQYIFLPFLFPLIIKKKQDIFDQVNWIMMIGLWVCIFGYITYLFVPSFTWENAVLSTFQSPICFGTFAVMLFLILLSRILVEKGLSSFWYIGLCIFYGSILTTTSFAALLSMLVGMIFLFIAIRPAFNTLSKVGAFLIISSLLFYSLGLFDKYIYKGTISISTYKKASGKLLYEEIPKTLENADTVLVTPDMSLLSSWEFLKKPYVPSPDNTYYFPFEHTSVAARIAYFNEIVTYLETAPIKDILLGDFSLKNHFEYDNVYFYFIKNDGIIVAALLFILLSSGVFIGLRKYILFIKSGNREMAGLSMGIAAFLFTSTIIQFNLSYFLTIYPHNFLTYFFLLLIFFVNPSEYSNNRVNEN